MWKKIDTAPKDGSSILVWGGRHFWEGLSCPEDGCNAEFVSMVNWRNDMWESGEESWREPTHWMPLPDGPAHDSDCSTHNEPAMPNGPCDCSLSQ